MGIRSRGFSLLLVLGSVAVLIGWWLWSFRPQMELQQLPTVKDVGVFTQWCSRQLTAAQASLDALENHRGEVTEDSFLRPFDQLLTNLDNTGGLSGLFEYVHPDAVMRERARTCSQQLQTIATDVSLSRPVYDRLQKVEIDSLDEKAARYHADLLRDYRRSGVSLDTEQRENIRELKAKIHEYGQEFSRNINEDRRFIEISDYARLKGLPEDFLLAHTPDENGVVRISTDYPDFLPVMKYAEDDSLRFEMYRTFLNRATPDNHTTLSSLIELRWILAQLLGYDSYAHYDLETRMIKKPENALRFINRINRMAEKRSAEDYAVLLKRLQQEFPEAEKVGNWQKSWLDARIKRELYNLDPLEVRNYFPYARVKQGIFSLVEDLFGVRFVPWETDLWHEDVEAFQIYQGRRRLGVIYLDMHPRAGKYTHAAHFGLRTGVAGRQYPAAVLVCNFPRPDDPGGGLMEHSQVETFLHEFGHLLHSLFGGHQEWVTQSGIATERDFVEVPSQMLEEWVWDYPTLAKFAVNAEGETIPESLVEAMKGSRYFGRGLWTRNQMFYAALSLQYYSSRPEDLDLLQDMQRLQRQYSPYEYIEDTAFYNSFGHLYGYAASYYTYMWSLVIAADLFSEFTRKGLRDRRTARRFRREILEPGGSKDAADLIAAFLGRPHNIEAFRRELNTHARRSVK